MDNWTTDLPTEAGVYWFYGCPSMGACGEDYTPHAKPRFRLILVKVKLIGGGKLVGVGDGQFVYLTKFNKNIQTEAALGLWRRAELPELPIKESEELFAKATQ